MNTEKFVYVTYIATTQEKLWEALISPEFTEKYFFGRKVKSDWKVGSSITMGPDWDGEILKFDPRKIISFTFHHIEGEMSKEPVSKVTYELVPKNAVVKLTVTHEELSKKVHADIGGGWPQILSNLKSLLETGKAPM